MNIRSNIVFAAKSDERGLVTHTIRKNGMTYFCVTLPNKIALVSRDEMVNPERKSDRSFFGKYIDVYIEGKDDTESRYVKASAAKAARRKIAMLCQAGEHSAHILRLPRGKDSVWIQTEGITALVPSDGIISKKTGSVINIIADADGSIKEVIKKST